MPGEMSGEIMEISGVEPGEGEKEMLRFFPVVPSALELVGAILIPFALLLGTWLLVRGRGKKGLLGGLGIVRKCAPGDRAVDRPAADQVWCLFDRKGRRVLGRHPRRSGAARQERLIQLRKRGIL